MSEPISLQVSAPATAPVQAAPPVHSDPSDSGSAAADQFDALLQAKRADLAEPPAKAPASDTGSPGGLPPTQPETIDDAESDAAAGQNPLDQIAYSAGDSSVPMIALPVLGATAQPIVTAPMTVVAEPQAAMKAAPEARAPVAIAAQPLAATIPAATQPQVAETGSDVLDTTAALTPVAAPAPGGAPARPAQPARPAGDLEAAKASTAANRLAAAEATAGKNLPRPTTGAPEAAQAAQAVQTAQTAQTTGERPAVNERRRVTADAVADAAARRDEASSYILPSSETRVAERMRNASTPVELTSHTDASSPNNAAPVPVSADRAASIPGSHIETRVGERGWSQEFASQVTLLVSNREPQAEIRINPQHLGPVEVRIAMDGDKVSLAFTAVHPDTRAAIQEALPQLREMFADSGLSLGNASVSHESSHRDPSQSAFGGTARIVGDEAEIIDPAVMARVVPHRLVDTFA